VSTFDPDNPKTMGDHVRKFLADRRLAKQIEADLSDQATIEADYARMVAALDARDAQFWADMRADGVPVADPEPDPEPGSFADRYATAVAEAQADQWVAGHTPPAHVPACPEPGPEPEPEAEA
jgi:hypothetical protein